MLKTKGRRVSARWIQVKETIEILNGIGMELGKRIEDLEFVAEEDYQTNTM